MYGTFQKHLQDELKAIEEAGLYKRERNIASAQSAEITLQDGSKALNFCANNYLGLADSPRLVAAAEKAMKERGYGMSSVRFICGTQDIHKELEKAIADCSRPCPFSDSCSPPSSCRSDQCGSRVRQEPPFKAALRATAASPTSFMTRR